MSSIYAVDLIGRDQQEYASTEPSLLYYGTDAIIHWQLRGEGGGSDGRRDRLLPKTRALLHAWSDALCYDNNIGQRA